MERFEWPNFQYGIAVLSSEGVRENSFNLTKVSGFEGRFFIDYSVWNIDIILVCIGIPTFFLLRL